MIDSEPARTTTREILRLLIAALLVVSGGMAPALCYQLLALSSSTAAPPIDALRSDRRGAPGEPVCAVAYRASIVAGEIQIDAVAWHSNNAHGTGSARSRARNPATTNRASQPSITVAHD